MNSQIDSLEVDIRRYMFSVFSFVKPGNARSPGAKRRGTGKASSRASQIGRFAGVSVTPLPLFWLLLTISENRGLVLVADPLLYIGFSMAMCLFCANALLNESLLYPKVSGVVLHFVCHCVQYNCISFALQRRGLPV